jgi:hypothetical protein
MLHIQLVVSMSLGDMVFAAHYFVSSIVVLGKFSGYSITGDIGCTLIALLGVFGVLGSIGWSFMIAINLFLMVAFPIKYASWSRRRLLFSFYSMLIWGTCLASCVASFLGGGLGAPSKFGRCWLTNAWAQQAVILFEVVAFLWACFVFAFSTCRVLSKPSFRGEEKERRMIAQTLIFVLVFCCTWMWDVFAWTFNMKSPIILRCYTVSLGSAGFFNFLVWRSRVFQSHASITKPLFEGLSFTTIKRRLSSFSLGRDNGFTDFSTSRC